jgi:ribonuclease R
MIKKVLIGEHQSILSTELFPCCLKNFLIMCVHCDRMKEKLTYSAVFELDANANIQNQWFGQNNYQFKIVDLIIKKHKKIMKPEKEIWHMRFLNLISLQRSLRRNALKMVQSHLNVLRLNLIWMMPGKPLGVYFKEAKDSNHLIEEFMLLANKKVAEYIGHTLNKPLFTGCMMNRILKNCISFSNFIKQFRYNFTFRDETEISKSLNQLLYEVKRKK